MFGNKVMPYILGNDSTVHLPRYYSIKHVKYSMLYDGAALWNALDGMSANAQSTVDFKTMMETWSGVTSYAVCKSWTHVALVICDIVAVLLLS